MKNKIIFTLILLCLNGKLFAQCLGIPSVINLDLGSSTLVSGTANTVGSKYRYDLAAPGIDALVTLVSFTSTGVNASKITFNTTDLAGTSAGYSNNLQPTFTFGTSGSANIGLTTGEAVYKIELSDASANGTTVIPVYRNFTMQTIDNDGASTSGYDIHEEIQYDPATAYVLNSPTALTNVAPNIYESPLTTAPSASISIDPQYVSYVYYANRTSILYTIRLIWDQKTTSNPPSSQTRYYSMSMNCLTSPNVNALVVSLSGNVYNDANKLADNTVNGTGIGTVSSQPLFVNLIDSNNVVIASTQVSSTGTYSFAGQQIYTNYKLQVSTTQGVEGDPMIASTFPLNWSSSGENLGSVAGNDGLANGILSVSAAMANISNANFGLFQCTPAPSVPIVGTITNTNCGTSSVALSGLPSTGTWTINPGNITGTGTTKTISGLNSGTYNFSVTNASGCISDPSTDVVIATKCINLTTENGSTTTAGGTAITNIASNDQVNGITATVGSGGNAVISTSGTWPSGITLNASTGAVSVASGTTPGIYNVTYKLCENAVPSNCSTMTDIVTVSSALSLTTENGSTTTAGGTAISNIASNDQVNGVTATVGSGGNAVISTSGTLPSGITLNANTGAVSVASGTTPGNYNVIYKLCESVVPSNCSTMTDQITVSSALSLTTENGSTTTAGGTAITNIASNDQVNGITATVGSAGNAVISTNGVWPSGITLNASSGAVSVASGTTPGIYNVIYKLCESAVPSNCNTMTDIVTVSSALSLTTENGSTTTAGGTAITNIASNDKVNGITATVGSGGNAVISTSGTWPSGITLNTSTGAVSLASGTTPGIYNVTYKLCESAVPSNCSNMTDQVTVSSALSLTTESGSTTTAGGTAISNITSNDKVNGVTAIVGSGGNAVISTSGTWPSGITLNTSTGAVSVASGTTPGNYNVIYKLCESVVPSNCSTMTDQVTVSSALSLTTESGSTTTAGGTAISNITSNDKVNGVTAIVGSGGNAVISTSGTWPSGITLNASTAAVSVASGTTSGIYNVTYKLCESAVPSNCSTMTDIVNVSPILNLKSDSATISTSGGIAIPNVLVNDLIGANVPTAGVGGDVIINKIGVWPSGIILDLSTGQISVQAGTPVGTYNVSYQLCEISYPTVCSTVVDKIKVIINPILKNDVEAFDPGNPVTVYVTYNDDSAIDINTIKLLNSSNQEVSSLSVANQGIWSVNNTDGAITFNPFSGYLGIPTPVKYTAKNLSGVAALNPAQVSLTNSAAASVLYVELIDFVGENNGSQVILQWHTALETNAKNFVILKSKDAKVFNEIGVVLAVGNSDILNGYTFDDNSPIYGISYYRLKSVDMDGSFQMSSIIAIRHTDLIDFTIMPNPVYGNTFSLQGNIANISKIELCDLIGNRQLLTYTSNIENLINVDLSSSLPVGMYILKIDTKNHSQSNFKLMVNH